MRTSGTWEKKPEPINEDVDAKKKGRKNDGSSLSLNHSTLFSKHYVHGTCVV